MSKAIHSAQAKRLRQLLAQHRRDAGLSQAQLAAKIGRPQTFVSKVEIGERRIDLIELLQVLGALRVDPAEFITSLTRRKP